MVGTGAVGGFYGGKLAQAGARVATLCRSDYEVVREKGIQVTSIWGDFHFIPEQVVRRVADYGEPPDYILVALKALPHIDIVQMIKDKVGPETAIVMVQNGLDIERPVAASLPNNEVIGGLAFICVTRVGPGQIHHQDVGHLLLGLYPSGDSERVQGLASLFKSSGVPCRVTTDVVTARWRKLVWNAPFNPISVLGGGADTREIMNTDAAVDLARAVMEEVCKIAAGAGHPLPPEVVEENLKGTRAMKPYKTSMLVDYEAGRPMEVEAIVGRALQVARGHGISTPYLESLYALLKLLEG